MLFDNLVCGGPSLEVPEHVSLGQHVLDRLRENCHGEDKIALINGATGHKTTYKRVLQDIVNISTGLTNIGITKGDVVALCSENKMEYMTTALGAICCGATVTTVNVLYTTDEILHVLGISRPCIIFCSEAALKLNLSTIRSVSSIKRIIQLEGSPVASDVATLSSVAVEADARCFQPAAVHGWTDVVFILYSSGTTGLPKGVMLTHFNLLYVAASLDYGYTRERCPTILSILPWYHVFGLITTIHYLTCNKLIIYMAGFNPEKYLKAIQEYRVNAIFIVPPIVVFMAKSPLVEKFDLSSIESVWYGAAPLSIETANAALKRMTNCKTLIQLYGMTETTLAAIKDYDIIDAKPGARPLPGMTAKVVNVETREKQGPYQKGEVCLKGPIVMKGYAGNEAATRAMFDEEGYLKTGDIGYYNEDGCFFIVDRLKELIKYKGLQVAPAAVESVILQHHGVAECGVVGTPDEHAGELPTAFVVAKPGARLTERDLLDFTAARLSPAARLRGGVIFVDEIPKNPSGKILRRVLRQALHLRNKKM